MKTITSRKAYKTVLQLPEMWQSKSKVLYYSYKIEVLCCHRTFIFLLSLVLVTEPLADFPRPSQLLVLPILFLPRPLAFSAILPVLSLSTFYARIFSSILVSLKNVSIIRAFLVAFSRNFFPQRK